MGLVDKLRAYLNEEDLPEEDANDKKPGSEGKSADGRVLLQTMDEDPGVSLTLSDEAIKAAKKSKGEKPKSKTDKREGSKSTSNGRSTANRRSIQFVDETKQGAEGKVRTYTSEDRKEKKEEPKPEINQSENKNDKSISQDFDNMSREELLEHVFGDTFEQEEPSPRQKRKEERQRAKAVKRLAKAIKRRGKLLGQERVREDKADRRKERIRSEGADIEKLILSKATKEEAEKQAVDDFCEQLIDVSSHMDEMKKEYMLVSSYLMDIQRIDELPIEYANEVIRLAEQIDRLNKNREEYIKSESLLSDEQYSVLAQLEKEVPGTIKKLYDMETRDSVLKSDMGHLEGEKADLKYMREEFTDSIAKIRGVITTVLILGIMTLGVVGFVAYLSKSTVTVYVLFIMAVVMLVFAIGYAKYATLRSDVKMNDARLAKAVSLLNKVKVKYINNTNTMDYIYDKYGVHSSSELEYVWDRYNTMVRDLLRYSEANKGLREANAELVSKLKSYGLQEAEVWPSQIVALIDRREMVEIRHTLNTRRQKLRESIETCDRIRTNAITALRAAVAENPGMAEHIRDVLRPYKLSIM